MLGGEFDDVIVYGTGVTTRGRAYKQVFKTSRECLFTFPIASKIVAERLGILDPTPFCVLEYALEHLVRVHNLYISQYQNCIHFQKLALLPSSAFFDMSDFNPGPRYVLEISAPLLFFKKLGFLSDILPKWSFFSVQKIYRNFLVRILLRFLVAESQGFLPTKQVARDVFRFYPLEVFPLEEILATREEVCQKE